MPDFLYEKESYEIRGACFDVYKVFGGAFKEKVVDRALTEALKNRGLEVEDQKRINIYFKGKKVGVYIPDKIVNNSVLLELKAKSFLTKQDTDQFWKYVKGSEYKLGFLSLRIRDASKTGRRPRKTGQYASEKPLPWGID